MDGRAGAGAGNKKRLRLDAWAFARISLRLTDREYSRYTPAEISALTRAYLENKQAEYALSLSSALVSKWSCKEVPIPYQPKDFLPPTEEERERRVAVQKKRDQANAKLLAVSVKSLAASLPKIKRDA